ncbi:hypothetical protein HN51_022305 [Arachis hypogaea]|uniref:Uncharacterized protein n=1 Tax=Arachis hypogaea TaxID=3818 RepID=A0A445EDA9_ARAHY|nr:hypothetical protein Ahy_A02g007738 [Arachis hypogaea]
MLELALAVAFSSVPLTLYVPPIRSFTLFVQSLQGFLSNSTLYALRAYPRLRLAASRIFNFLFLHPNRNRTR